MAGVVPSQSCGDRNDTEQKVLGRGKTWEDGTEAPREKLVFMVSLLSGCHEVQFSHDLEPTSFTLWQPARASPAPPNSVLKQIGLEISVLCSSLPLSVSPITGCVPGTDYFCPEPPARGCLYPPRRLGCALGTHQVGILALLSGSISLPGALWAQLWGEAGRGHRRVGVTWPSQPLCPRCPGPQLSAEPCNATWLG